MDIIEKTKLDRFDDILQMEKLILNNDDIVKHSNTLSPQKESGLLMTGIMLVYISQTRKEYDCFFTEKFTWELYDDLINELKKYIKTTPLGVFSVYSLNKGIKKFTRDKGKKIHLMKNYWKWNLNSVYEYIKSGLFSGAPVLMLTWRSSYKELNNNWICVTELRKYKDGEMEIEVLTVEGKKTYDLKKWLADKSLYKGIIYYK